jgi:hypothetical protein
MSAALALIGNAGRDEVRGYLPQFCRRWIFLAQFDEISGVRAH